MSGKPGIERYGVYVPRYRLTAAMLKSAWGTGPSKGERALANHDEDPVTMAVEAAENCLAAGGAEKIEALYFASASAPYAEKSSAATVAAALDMPDDGFLTADFGSGLRAGTAALRAAADAVAAGSSEEVLVAASEMRVAEPGTPQELAFGDAAAALRIGKNNPVATLDCFFSVNSELTDIWRRAGDRFHQTEDAKFILEKGYGEYLKRALDGLLKKSGVKKDELAKAVFYAPDAAGFKYQAKALSLKPEQLAESQLETIGCAGCATPFLALAAALDAAKPGDRIAMLSYGSGADAVLLTVTDEIKNHSNPRGLKAQAAARRDLSSYQKYLRFRELISLEKVIPFAPEPLIWRERKAILSRYGVKCNKCGTFAYPPRRVCRNCDSKDDFTAVKLGRRGKVFTFAKDHLVPCPDLPVVMISADMEGGGRLYAQYTDAPADSVQVGMDVELCFRRINEGGGHYNYFWKFRKPLV